MKPILKSGFSSAHPGNAASAAVEPMKALRLIIVFICRVPFV